MINMNISKFSNIGRIVLFSLLFILGLSCGLINPRKEIVEKEVEVIKEVEVEIEKEVVKEVEVIKEVGITKDEKDVICLYSTLYPVLWDNSMNYFRTTGLSDSEISQTMGEDAYNIYIVTDESSPAISSKYCE